MRKCKKCLTEKALSEFYKNNSYKSGYELTCKACRTERMRAHRDVNKDAINARKRAYKRANKEKIAAASKVYREANKDKVKARDKAYREANKKKIREYHQTR